MVPMTHDLVIRNGTVVDGTGLPPYRADVGGRRTGASRRSAGSASGAREEIDAEGHVVTPGFIDGHTHMDAQVFWDPLGTCSCWHGVTTVVMGNCGFTLAPARADAAAPGRAQPRAGRGHRRRRRMAAGIDWTWETFPEYLDAVDRLPKGINYAAQHRPLGAAHLGDGRAGLRASRRPTTTSR